MTRIISFVMSVTLLMTSMLCISVSAAQNGICGENATWVLDKNGTLTISGTGKIADTAFNAYENESFATEIKTVIINDGITEIGDNAFGDCKSIETVKMADSVTTIVAYAFSGCSSLKNIELSRNLTFLGGAAFHSCESLEKITLPDNAKIDSNVMVCSTFTLCNNLKEINVNSTNNLYNSVDGILYSKDMKTLIAYPPGKIGNTYITPNTVNTIGVCAFASCDNLDTIVLSEGVTTIDAYVFVVDDLKELYLPKSLSEIGYYSGVEADIYYAGTEAEWNNVVNNTSIVPNYFSTEYNSKEKTIQVLLDNEYITFDQPPILMNDRTMVPMRAIFEAIGATVDWDNENATAIASKGDTIISITIGSDVLYVNNDIISLDAPACIVNDRTLVPVRAIAESTGYTVDWDGNTSTVLIYTK